VDADVIEVPVEPVFRECDDGVGTIPLDHHHDLRMQFRHVVPAQVAVVVIEQDDFGDAEHGRGIAQFARPDHAEVAVRHE